MRLILIVKRGQALALALLRAVELAGANNSEDF